MENKQTEKSWEERFYEELVEMSPLRGRDMHNRPPLHETTFDKIDEIKDFIRKELASQREEFDKLWKSKNGRLKGLEIEGILKAQKEDFYYCLTGLLAHMESAPDARECRHLLKDLILDMDKKK